MIEYFYTVTDCDFRERMFELRRLTHGERPVSGQGHVKSLDQFFSRYQQQQQPSGQDRNKPTTSSGHRDDDVRAADDGGDRPEAVRVEISALFERRPVTSLIQSEAFRRQLERAVRGGITRENFVSQRGNSGTGQRPTPAPRTIAAADSRTTTDAPAPSTSVLADVPLSSSAIAQDANHRNADQERRPSPANSTPAFSDEDLRSRILFSREDAWHGGSSSSQSSEGMNRKFFI